MNADTARFRRAPSVLFRAVGDEVVLAPAEGDDFHRLSPTGGVVWGLLATPRSLRELVATLAETYEEPSEVIAPGVESLVEDLLRHGIVEEVAGRE